MVETATELWRRHKCLKCGCIYDESEGWPEDVIAAGIRSSDVLGDWIWAECGSQKRDFNMIDWE